MEQKRSRGHCLDSLFQAAQIGRAGHFGAIGQTKDKIAKGQAMDKKGVNFLSDAWGGLVQEGGLEFPRVLRVSGVHTGEHQRDIKAFFPDGSQ